MRRHRITENEMTPVMRAVHSQLQRDLQNGFTPDTIQLFHVLWRFHTHRTGPPSYPELTTEELEKLLEKSADIFKPE
jgi:hypothetical protein